MFLQANEVITLIIVIFGYLTVTFSYREHPSTRIFFLGYSCLVVGILATNLMHLFPYHGLNIVAHVVGVMGSSLVFVYFAYQHYQQDRFLRKKLEELGK